MKEPFHALNIDKGEALGHFVCKMHAVMGIDETGIQEFVKIVLSAVSVVAFFVKVEAVVVDALGRNVHMLTIALFALEEFVFPDLRAQDNDHFVVLAQIVVAPMAVVVFIRSKSIPAQTGEILTFGVFGVAGKRENFIGEFFHNLFLFPGIDITVGAQEQVVADIVDATIRVVTASVPGIP